MMDLLVGAAPPHACSGSARRRSATQSLDRGRQGDRRGHAPGGREARADVVYIDTYKLFSTSRRRLLAPHPRRERQRDRRCASPTACTSPRTAPQYLARAVFTLHRRALAASPSRPTSTDPIGWTLAPGSGESVPGFSSTPPVAVPLRIPRRSPTTSPSSVGARLPRPEPSTTPHRSADDRRADRPARRHRRRRPPTTTIACHHAAARRRSRRRARRDARAARGRSVGIVRA